MNNYNISSPTQLPKNYFKGCTSIKDMNNDISPQITLPNNFFKGCNISKMFECGQMGHKYDFGIDFKSKSNELVIGKLYSLSGCECDDFEMPIKIYKLIAILNDLESIELNSLIVKQVGGEIGTIFSLTKFDCETLSIPFEKGLQIFPKGMPWKEYKEDNAEEDNKCLKLANLNDLSTYPTSPIDDTIRNIIMKVNGYKTLDNKVFIQPNGRRISIEELYNRLTVICKENISSNIQYQTARFIVGEEIPYIIASNENSDTFIELNLTKKVYNHHPTTIDEMSGIYKASLKDKTTDDLFDVFIKNEEVVTPSNQIAMVSENIDIYGKYVPNNAEIEKLNHYMKTSSRASNYLPSGKVSNAYGKVSYTQPQVTHLNEKYYHY